MASRKGRPVPRISLEEAQKRMSEVTFLDARSAAARARNPRQLPGALHVPVKEVDQALRWLPRNRVLVAYCT